MLSEGEKQRIILEFLNNKDTLFSTIYPSSFLKEVLQKYTEFIPFYYLYHKGELILYTLKRQNEAIHIPYLIGKNLVYPVIHAYHYTKGYREIIVTTHSKNTEIIKQAENSLNSRITPLTSLIVVSKKDLFVGEDIDKTFAPPFARFINPVLRLREEINISPFWIEISCSKKTAINCFEMIKELIKFKGVIKACGSTELLKEVERLINTHTEYEAKIENFALIKFSKIKIEQMKENQEIENICLTFNPFGEKINLGVGGNNDTNPV